MKTCYRHRYYADDHSFACIIVIVLHIGFGVFYTHIYVTTMYGINTHYFLYDGL